MALQVKKTSKIKFTFAKKRRKKAQYWLRLVAHTEIDHEKNCLVLWKEAHELTLIFSKNSTEYTLDFIRLLQVI